MLTYSHRWKALLEWVFPWNQQFGTGNCTCRVLRSEAQTDSSQQAKEPVACRALSPWLGAGPPATARHCRQDSTGPLFYAARSFYRPPAEVNRCSFLASP
jgi:hypothetical protein